MDSTVEEHDFEPDGEDLNLTRDSDSEESDEEEDAFEDIVKVTFTEIRDRLKKRQLVLDNDEAEREFEKKYGEWLSKQTTDEPQTLLHMIVEDASDDVIDQYERLVEFLFERHPELFDQQNSAQHTPLYMAVQKKRSKLVKFICDKLPSEKVKRLLARPCLNGENCVHLAIRVKSSFARTLVRHAGADALCMQDGSGKTPLHLAVEYERCTDSQPKVVKELIKRGVEALDKETQDGLSPYRLHEQTRREELDKRRAAQDKERDAPRGKGNEFPSTATNVHAREKDGAAERSRGLDREIQAQWKDNIGQRHQAQVKNKAGMGPIDGDQRKGM